MVYVVASVLAVWYVFIYHVPIYWTILCAVFYVLWYLDGTEYTGERRWPAFRTLSLWRTLSPVGTRTISNMEQLCVGGKRTRRIYVMLPCDTVLSAVWGVGIHSGALPFAETLHYMVPPLLLNIPVLRDVLLWSGAVTWHAKKRPQDTVLLDLLNSGRSVCVFPSNFANVIKPQFDAEVADAGAAMEDLELGVGRITVSGLSEELLSFARTEHVELVPIMMHNERRRYWFPRSPLLRSVQRFAFRVLLFPLPMVFALRMCGKRRPPPLVQQFGPIIHCTLERYPDNATLRKSIEESVKQMCAPHVDDSIVFDE